MMYLASAQVGRDLPFNFLEAAHIKVDFKICNNYRGSLNFEPRFVFYRFVFLSCRGGLRFYRLK